MKRTWSVLIICLLVESSNAQQSKIDSIHGLPPRTIEDVELADRYAGLIRFHFNIAQFDSSDYYSNKLLELSRRLDYSLGEIKAKLIYFTQFNNLPKALEVSYECFDLSQKIGDTVALMNSLFALNVVYRTAEQYDKSVEFGKQLLTIATAAADSNWIWNALFLIGNSYAFQEKEKDSCLKYFQECYRFGISVHNGAQRWVWENADCSRNFKIGWSLYGLGMAHHLLDEHALALVYFLKALPFSPEIPQRMFFLAEEYMGIAGVYMKMNKPDSAVRYSKLWLEAARHNNMHIIRAATMLARAYEDRNNDSAVKYFKKATEVREIQFSEINKAEVENIVIKAAEKQRELVAQQVKIREERKRNLQYVSIGVGLISFIVLFLLLSQTIIVRSGFVRFLGLVGMILVFEFINLLLHPFIGDFTHHSPFWMFLIIVSVAALLVPAHHKLEKWVTHQLVEKNKRIRLAAAKRTIAKLESE
jgi:tetratricopeptide (TPR) repeat protein